MPADTSFTKNEWHTDFQVRTWIHSNHQKKHRSTKQRMEKPTPMKIEKAWKGLHSVADNDILLQKDWTVQWTGHVTSGAVDIAYHSWEECTATWWQMSQVHQVCACPNIGRQSTAVVWEQRVSFCILWMEMQHTNTTGHQIWRGWSKRRINFPSYFLLTCWALVHVCLQLWHQFLCKSM